MTLTFRDQPEHHSITKKSITKQPPQNTLATTQRNHHTDLLVTVIQYPDYH